MKTREIPPAAVPRPTPSRLSRVGAVRAVFGLALAAAIWIAFGFTAAAGAEYPQVAPAAAGAEPRNPGLVFDRVDVQVWPEYDAPQVLVISEFVLPPGTAMPAAFDMAIPKGAQVTALGDVDTKGEYRPASGAPRVDRSGGEWDVAKLEVKGSHVLRMEYYYDPGLDLNGPRQFEFLYEFPGDAKEASLVVQRPARSSSFRLEPKLEKVMTGKDQLIYEMQEFGNIVAGERYLLEMAYSKNDAEPSVEPATAGEPPQEGKAARDNLLIVTGMLGVLVLGALGYGIRGRRGNSELTCPECGNTVQKEANFCISCGASRRETENRPVA